MPFLLLLGFVVTGQLAPEAPRHEIPEPELLEPGILEPHLSVQRVERDVRTVPPGHFMLIEDAGRLEKIDRAAYFERLERYLDVATDCSNPENVTWLLEFAHRTRTVPDVESRVTPAVDRLVLEEPACFLRGARDVVFAGQPLTRFVLAADGADSTTRQAAIEPVLAEPAFASLAETYRRQKTAYAERLAREAARRQWQLAQAREKHRAPLLDRTFMESDEQAYWRLWEEVSRNARDCGEAAAVADLLDAAVMHDSAGRRPRSAEFVEILVIENPLCVLDAMDVMHDSHAFIDYLASPLLYARSDLLGQLAYANGNAPLGEQQERVRDVHDGQLEAVLDRARGDARFLWQSHDPYVDDAGRVYIGFPGKFPVDVAGAWQQATPHGTHYDGKYEVRQLPPGVVDLPAGSGEGEYQLLNIVREGVNAITVRPVNVALLQWFCKGPVPVLQLEPETQPEWLQARRPPVIVVHLRDGVSLPEVMEHHFDRKSWFISGRLTWPLAGRSFDFRYSAGYTDTIFNLEDNQTGEKRYVTDTGWMCH